jgi:hypothetical protein
VGEHVALEVDDAPLPAHPRQLLPGDRRLDALVVVRDRQPDAFWPRSMRPRSKEAYAAPFSEPATSTANTSRKPSSSTPTHANKAMRVVTLAPQRTFR